MNTQSIVKLSLRSSSKPIDHYRRYCKSFQSSLALIDLGAGREVAWVRFYGNGNTSYCAAFFLLTAYGVEASALGLGKAGGYGYHKDSAAMDDALTDAGITLAESISGRGDSSMREALLALAAHLNIARPFNLPVKGSPMSEANEIAANMASRTPLLVASLRGERAILAHLDSIGFTAAEVGYQVRANVAEALEVEATRLQKQAGAYRGAPMGVASKGGPAAPSIATFDALERFAGQLINSDPQGLDVEDSNALTEFCRREGYDATRGHFSVADTDPYFARCEVTGMRGMCVGYAYVMRAPSTRYTLRRVRLNSGGYDDAGSYWGLGAPLYAFSAEGIEHSGHVRARSRDLAKAAVRALAPSAEFFR